MKLLSAALIGALLALQPPLMPLVFGPRAATIRAADIEAITRAVAPHGGSPWLLTEFWSIPLRNGEREWVALAYLAPSIATPEFRRGPLVDVTTELTAESAPDPMTWKVDDPTRILTWAQVALPGRSFDDVTGDADENRPLHITGDITDADLVSIVRFVRARPSLPNPNSRLRLPPEPGPVRAILGPAIRHPALPSARVTLGIGAGCFYDVLLERPEGGEWTGSVEGGVGCR
jgi:hypothetical protein